LLFTQQVNDRQGPVQRQEIAKMKIADVADAKPIEGHRPARAGNLDLAHRDVLGHVHASDAAAADLVGPHREQKMPNAGALIFPISLRSWSNRIRHGGAFYAPP